MQEKSAFPSEHVPLFLQGLGLHSSTSAKIKSAISNNETFALQRFVSARKLTYIADVALPALPADALEGVDLVHTSSPVLTWVVFAVVNV